MPRRVWAWVAHVVAWSLLAVGVTVLVLDRRGGDDEPAAAEPPRYAAMPFPSTLSLNGTDRGRIGSRFRFTAEGFSDAGTTSVTLYDGSRVVDEVRPGTDRAGRAGALDLALPALSVGRHTVHAVVTDGDGKVAETAPVAVLVGAAPGEVDVPVVVPVLEDEHPRDVAARLGVPVSALVGGIRGGALVVKVAPDAGASLVDGDEITVGPAASLGPFTLSAQASGCGVELHAEGVSAAITYYRGGGSTSGWVEVRSTVRDLSPGTHAFFARSGGRDSGTVEVTVPDRCAQGYGWTGDASVVDGVLTIPKAASGVFLHLSVDGRPWIRVPASQDEALDAGTKTSIAHLLPALDGRRLELEVWQSGEFPRRVATGQLRVPSDRSLASIVGEPSAVSLTVSTPDGERTGIQLGSQHQELTFTWTAASPAATRVRWQVLALDSRTSDLALSPSGLLASGVSEGDAKGTFTVDTADIPRADVEPEGGAVPKGTAVALKPPVPTGTLASTPAYASLVPVSALTDPSPPVELPVEGSTVYVRVVTETGPAAASPDVLVHLPVHQSKGTGVDFQVENLYLDAGRAPNPKAVGCLIVDVPWTLATRPTYESYGYGGVKGDLTTYVASQFYPQDGTWCPGAFPPPKGCDAWYCDVVDFVVDAAGVVVGVVVQVYELVSYAYNGVIDGVVSAIAKYNPLCVALGAADGGAGSGCETVVGFATRAAVTAVLASVGLPPSLPTTDQLEAIAAGELDQLAVEVMKQLGVPCDTAKAPAGFDTALASAGEALDAPVLGSAADPCLAVAHLLIGEVRERATADAERALADASGLPSFPDIKGFTMTADPRGRTDPLTVDVVASVVEADADPTGLFCQVVVHDPHRAGVQSVGPYGSFLIRLEPSSQDGRTWSGRGVRMPSGSDVVTRLQGASYDVGVRSQHPSECQIADTTGTVALRAPDQ